MHQNKRFDMYSPSYYVFDVLKQTWRMVEKRNKESIEVTEAILLEDDPRIINLSS